MKEGLSISARENILQMVAYSSARHEFTGMASIFLDANENPYGSPIPQAVNRYPDPLQHALKEKISRIKGIPPANIFLGNGSDEAIDLLYRIYAEPGQDNVILCPPTYGMYEVCAGMNNIATKQVPLLENFQLDLAGIESAIDEHTKMIFICSPNNPTGNSMHAADVEVLLNNFDGLVIIDEAYINFSRQRTFIPELTEYPNLVILQTLSKAWGLAGLRLGMAFAGAPIINLMNKVKYPYNISSIVQDLGMEALDQVDKINNWTKEVVAERSALAEKLNALSFVQKVFPSDANFILVRMGSATRVYEYLMEKGIIVRDRSRVMLCEDCLRITIGTPTENSELIQALHAYPSTEKTKA